MIESKLFDEMAKKFVNALPPGLREFQKDMERNFKSAMQATFAKLDLVTREEFDIQANVLSRTRAKLTEVEKRLAQLEVMHAAKSASASSKVKTKTKATKKADD